MDAAKDKCKQVMAEAKSVTRKVTGVTRLAAGRGYHRPADLLHHRPATSGTNELLRIIFDR